MSREHSFTWKDCTGVLKF